MPAQLAAPDLVADVGPGGGLEVGVGPGVLEQEAHLRAGVLADRLAATRPAWSGPPPGRAAAPSAPPRGPAPPSPRSSCDRLPQHPQRVVHSLLPAPPGRLHPHRPGEHAPRAPRPARPGPRAAPAGRPRRRGRRTGSRRPPTRPPGSRRPSPRPAPSRTTRTRSATGARSRRPAGSTPAARRGRRGRPSRPGRRPRARPRASAAARRRRRRRRWSAGRRARSSRSRGSASTRTCSPFQREVCSTRPTYSTRHSRSVPDAAGENVLEVDTGRDEVRASGRVRQRHRRDRDQRAAAGEDPRQHVALVGAQQRVDRVAALDQRAGVVGQHDRHRRGERREVGQAGHRRVRVDDVDVRAGAGAGAAARPRAG